MLVALSIIAGLILLVVGGDNLVKGAVHIAERLKISPLVIGIVLVGFGTSTPELITSIMAAFKEAPGIAIGNIVGSNSANILLILGATAIIAPIAIVRDVGFKQDVSFLLGSALLLVAICFIGHLSSLAGVVLLCALVAYMALAFRRSQEDQEASNVIESEFGAPRSLWRDALFFVGGLIATMVGAKLLVDGSITLARDFGLSETVIGLTIVAVGTSLPELVASIMAALRKHADIAYGNIVGSNIYNILGILGVTSVVHPISIPPQILQVDIWVMLGATAALIICAFTGGKIDRAKGVFLLLAYVSYSLYLASVA